MLMLTTYIYWLWNFKFSKAVIKNKTHNLYILVQGHKVRTSLAYQWTNSKECMGILILKIKLEFVKLKNQFNNKFPLACVYTQLIFVNIILAFGFMIGWQESYILLISTIFFKLKTPQPVLCLIFWPKM